MGVVLLLAIALVTAQSDRATVYVSASMRDGFVEMSKGIEDSVKDISRRLAKMKEFRLVNSREKADIVLVVLARSEGRSIEFMAKWVQTVMEVGQYQKEFWGHDGPAPISKWGSCADQIADHVKAWTLANREQLRQRREAH